MQIFPYIIKQLCIERWYTFYQFVIKIQEYLPENTKPGVWEVADTAQSVNQLSGSLVWRIKDVQAGVFRDYLRSF